MTLVGNRAGKRKILWGQLFKMTALLVPLTTALVSLTYLVFAGRWNPLAAWLGLGGGFVIVLVIFISNLFTPVFRLPYVK